MLLLSISDYVWMALRKAKRQQGELAEAWGYSSKQAINNKFSRDSWSANDLAKLAEFTGGKLAIVYPDGQEILIPPQEEKKA